MEKIREGIIFITGEKLLSALSWRYAEERACGKHFTDLEYLKKFTNYEGIFHNAEGQERKWFWEILEEMDEEDRQLYLRFVNGQSKLATDLSALSYKHKLTEMRGGDAKLPIAHTCYNTIDLPKYTTKEIFRKRLLVAIRFCGETDLDNRNSQY
jgi:hypothetical protein